MVRKSVVSLYKHETDHEAFPSCHRGRDVHPVRFCTGKIGGRPKLYIGENSLSQVQTFPGINRYFCDRTTRYAI